MTVIKPNTSLRDLDTCMFEVEIITGGYVTEEKIIPCKTLEKFASSNNMEKIDFYINEAKQIFTFHYGYKLNLEIKILAIDYFPNYSQKEVNKIFDIIMGVIRRQKFNSRY